MKNVGIYSKSNSWNRGHFDDVEPVMWQEFYLPYQLFSSIRWRYKDIFKWFWKYEEIFYCVFGFEIRVKVEDQIFNFFSIELMASF